MVYFIWLTTAGYALFTLGLLVTWVRMRKYDAWPAVKQDTLVSVIMVVRNEAENIGQLLSDLNGQTYPCEQFEVIIADDGSTDATCQLIRNFIPQARFALTLFPLVTTAGVVAPKKKGIEESISRAKGELVVTTDGDCRVNTDWLSLIQHAYTTRGAKLISAGVTFEGEKGLFQKIQTVEFASLIGTGACALNAGFPTMCNGANLAYSRDVFLEVNGFAGINHLASGDDELLMHKIAERYPKGVFFLKHADAVVRTGAQATLNAFYNQRKRWASKWDAYKDWKVSMLAFIVFLVHLNLVLAVGMYTFRYISLVELLSLLGAKFCFEFILLGLFLVYLRKGRRILYIPLVQIIYPFYVVFFGLVAQKKGFVWKGRKMK